MLQATYDERDGIITTRAEGLSSIAEFEAYLPALYALMDRSAARHGQWLHVVDASNNAVQTKDSTAHVTSTWNDKPREDGYTAYLVTSVLAKMQIDRMRENPNKGYFADAASARAWLLERVGAAPALAGR